MPGQDIELGPLLTFSTLRTRRSKGLATGSRDGRSSDTEDLSAWMLANAKQDTALCGDKLDMTT